MTSSTTLTKEGLQAFKKARSIVLHYRNGESFINCIMHEDSRYKDVRVECGLERSGGFSGEYNLGDIVGASHVVMFPQYEEGWQAVLAFVKAGDDLTIKWRACNNNQYQTRAGLYQDEVFLVIRRTVRNKPFKLSLLVGHSTCENNTAKMIKHTSTPKSVIGDY